MDTVMMLGVAVLLFIVVLCLLALAAGLLLDSSDWARYRRERRERQELRERHRRWLE